MEGTTCILADELKLEWGWGRGRKERFGNRADADAHTTLIGLLSQSPLRNCGRLRCVDSGTGYCQPVWNCGIPFPH